jgi:hypothetical protein
MLSSRSIAPVTARIASTFSGTTSDSWWMAWNRYRSLPSLASSTVIDPPQMQFSQMSARGRPASCASSLIAPAPSSPSHSGITNVRRSPASNARTSAAVGSDSSVTLMLCMCISVAGTFSPSVSIARSGKMVLTSGP